MNKKVLVVDDDKVTLVVIQKLLEQNNLSVITSNVGTNISDIIAKEQPDILVTDIMMPNTDGLENISALRRDYPDLKIVAISSEPLYLEFAEKFGANYSYKKPIMGGDFSQLVVSAIS